MDETLTMPDWIPVSTPPKEDGVYMTYRERYQREVSVDEYRGGKWYWGPYGNTEVITADDLHPTHWLPRPATPKGDK